MAAYQGNVRDANEIALGESPLVAPLRRLVDERVQWRGTASELLDELNKLVEDKVTLSREWPKRANALSGQLRRLAPNLRKTGLEVELVPGRLRREIVLRQVGLGRRGPEQEGMSSSPSSPSSQLDRKS